MSLVALVYAFAGTGCSVVSAPYGAVTGPVGFFRDHAAYNDASEALVLGWRNHVWSKKAWYQQRHLFASHPYTKDFGKGFQAGYNDIANGGSGCVPVLPPREYWSWRYQSPEGQGKTAAWFEGYPLGAAAAEKDEIANWSHIQTGYTADSKSIRGRRNYVRIREELLKKELREEAEEVNPRPADPTPTPAPTPNPVDDLPPPKAQNNPPQIKQPVNPPATAPNPGAAKAPAVKPVEISSIEARSAEPKPAEIKSMEAKRPPERLPPILPPAGPLGVDDSAKNEPSKLPEHAAGLVRLPAVETEALAIQQVRADMPASPETVPFRSTQERARELITAAMEHAAEAPADKAEATQNPFAHRDLSAVAPVAEPKVTAETKPSEKAPETQVAAATVAKTEPAAAPAVVAPVEETEKWNTATLPRSEARIREAGPAVAPQTVAAPAASALPALRGETQPAETTHSAYKRAVALYPVGDKEAPPAMGAPAEPTSTAAALPKGAPLPAMRQLRRQVELPEAPGPTPLGMGTPVAREALREERSSRRNLGGPILDRSPAPSAGEVRLSDDP